MRIYLLGACFSLLLATQAQLAQANPALEVVTVLTQDSSHVDLLCHDLPRIEARLERVQLEVQRLDWIDRPYPQQPKFRPWPRVRYVYHTVRVKGQRYQLATLWSIKPPKKPKRDKSGTKTSGK